MGSSVGFGSVAGSTAAMSSWSASRSCVSSSCERPSRIWAHLAAWDSALRYAQEQLPRAAVPSDDEGVVRDVYHLRGQEVVIGREGPDVVFHDDPFISRRHARITYDEKSRSFVVEDLGSFNGTSLRFRGESELRRGDQFRVGNHLFLFEADRGER